MDFPYFPLKRRVQERLQVRYRPYYSNYLNQLYKNKKGPHAAVLCGL
nr:MAG TPA: hypothetical protein [Caudoviricetes sp.]